MIFVPYKLCNRILETQKWFHQIYLYIKDVLQLYIHHSLTHSLEIKNKASHL